MRVSKTIAWLAAIRPKTLPVGAAPVLVGSGFALRYGVFDPGPAAAALAGALLIQIGTNLANDYYDHRRGADTADRLGPPRATSMGWIPPTHVRVGAAVSFLLAALVGIYLISVAGWPILVVGLVSIASGYAYTAGPYPLSYHGWGDLFVFVFFGPVAVAGTYFVQDPTWPVPHGVIVAGAAVGALATAVLVVNNLRDLDSDRAAGKRTLAVQLGRRGTQIEYPALLVLAYAVALVPVLQGRVGPLFALPLATIPIALGPAHAVWTHKDPRELNPILARTGLLTFLYALLFGVGAAW